MRFMRVSGLGSSYRIHTDQSVRSSMEWPLAGKNRALERFATGHLCPQPFPRFPGGLSATHGFSESERMVVLPVPDGSPVGVAGTASTDGAPTVLPTGCHGAVDLKTGHDSTAQLRFDFLQDLGLHHP